MNDNISFVNLELIVGEQNLHLVSGVHEKVLFDILSMAMLVVFLQNLLLDMESVCVPDLLENVCRAPFENIWFGTGLIFHIEFYVDCREMV